MAKIIWMSPNINYNLGDGTYNNPYGPKYSSSTTSVKTDFGLEPGDEIRIKGDLVSDLTEKTHTDVKVYFDRSKNILYGLNAAPLKTTTTFYIVELDIVVVLGSAKYLDTSTDGRVYYDGSTYEKATQNVFFGLFIEYLKTNDNSFTMIELNISQTNISTYYYGFIYGLQLLDNITISDNWISETERSTIVGEALTIYNITSTNNDAYLYIFGNLSNCIVNCENTMFIPGHLSSKRHYYKFMSIDNTIININQLGRIDTNTYYGELRVYGSNVNINIKYLYLQKSNYLANTNIVFNDYINQEFNIDYMYVSNTALNIIDYNTYKDSVHSITVKNLIRYKKVDAEMIHILACDENELNINVGQTYSIGYISPSTNDDLTLVDYIISKNTLKYITTKNVNLKFLEKFSFDFYYTTSFNNTFLYNRQNTKEEIRLSEIFIECGYNNIDYNNVVDTTLVENDMFKDFTIPTTLALQGLLTSEESIVDIGKNIDRQLSTLYTPVPMIINSVRDDLNLNLNIMAQITTSTILPIIYKYNNIERTLLFSNQYNYNTGNISDRYHNVAEIIENNYLYKTISPSLCIKPVIMDGFRYYGDRTSVLDKRFLNIFKFKKLINIESGNYKVSFSCLMTDLVLNTEKIKIILRYNDIEKIEYEFLQKDLVSSWKDISFEFISNKNQYINIDFEFILESKKTQLIISDLSTLKIS